MKKFTKQQKDYFKCLRVSIQEAEDRYYDRVVLLEKLTKQQLGIDIEIFHIDGIAVGIGDKNREYNLVNWEELED